MRFSPAWKHSILLVALALSISACSSGGGGGDTQSNQQENAAALSNATILYSKQPRINEELSLSVKQQTGLEQSYTWTVTAEPLGANLSLTPLPEVNGVKLTPTVAGHYELRVTSEAESATVNFYIDPRFPFSANKVSLYEGTFADDSYHGRVTNQVWLYSQTLDQSRLEQLAAQYPTFQVVGYDQINGLLLQFDDSNMQNMTALGSMRLASGINSVVNRVVTGDGLIEESDRTPDDGSAFDDGGDNWHLERIGAEQAWDITTGSDNILIGISEPGEKFFINHEDLSGRFGLSLEASEGDDSHPSSVAGALGAVTDNGKGMSGINWVTRLSTAGSGEDELRRLAGSGSTKVINSSWGLLKAPAEGTDMADESVASAREEAAFDMTRGYRKLMSQFPNHLFVNSAGNGVKGPDGTAIDGRYHSPALQYSDIGTFRPVSNVLFVAAMQEDGKLRESSNYGESVEIAAPAGYKSIDGPNGYDTFSSTSSAAPVVTGVASLIYSVNPNFSAQTVKTILLSSATEFVSERHTESGNDGATEPLPNRIPVVNAAAAVQMAQELAAGLRAELIQTIDNPFRNITSVQVQSATGQWETVSFPYTLNSAEGFATGPEVKLTLDDPAATLTLSSNAVKFRNRGLGTASTGTFEQVLENPHIALNLFNRTSTLPVANAQITIEPVNVLNARFESVTDVAGANGQTNVYLMSGAYRVMVRAAGYENFTTLVNIVNQGQRIVVNLPLTPANGSTGPIGAGIDACLVGKWSLDIAHYQAQLDQADSGFVVAGDGIARLLPDGNGTLDLSLTYTAASEDQAFVTTITQNSRYKYEWRTDANVYSVESLGAIEDVISVVTIDGVVVPAPPAEPPATAPTDSSAPYMCVGDVWTVEASGENTIATRFNRL
ncbi:MAG: S8 family serine peptidase [Burkholderiaceae bacterium]